ncbi:Xaa-Pro aminopeptidase [Umboniibacter marinipuniceus]|uniref:Xaa-Pro aminopeptidase n=1 Tax=Umboniibacter marinipuniceus TaxID=569599 RepID=A0A3M0AML3_9GAMM|nr:Xaa-Pro aminopeptidase [Umboniibacter marinipuniceus]RMA80222.1 aminopeptidase P [Umboniibacter marinipuniceus]
MTTELFAKEFAARRAALLDSMPDNSVAFIATASELIRSNDADHHFRPESNFYYLTGFPEPEAVAFLVKNGDEGRFVLCCRAKDKDREIWDGRRYGPEAAAEVFGADEAHPISDLEKVAVDLLADRDVLLNSNLRQQEQAALIESWMQGIRRQRKQGVRTPETRIDVDAMIAEMRLFKSAAEIELMRTAAKISADAHARAMKFVKPGCNEYHLEAEIAHEFAMRGARFPAYNSIVGAGENACILHYVENNAEVKDGDLVLIDAGCEYQMYAADITRTFPANGKFSAEQRAIYEVVLNAQHAAIAQIKPGNPYEAVHYAAVAVLVDGLIALGLLVGDAETLIADEAYKEYYMHGTGHWLGIDVHDVGDYRVAGSKTWRNFEPGMVLTVEPGIYVSPSNDAVDAKWRGIGVRIEDDILVTESGYENLTAAVPKSIEEIEALMESQ